MNASIDLNCDLGEGCPFDAELMQLITSANIACGGHAGNDETMATTIRLAIANGVAIGAHPGYPDRENFGRQPLNLRTDVLSSLISGQIQRIKRIADSLGAEVSHVKPHGALYNQAAADSSIAQAVIDAVAAADGSLVLFGLANGLLIGMAQKAGLRTVGEAFADRRYLSNGRLAPRSTPGAVIEDPEAAAEQALRIARREPIPTIDGGSIVVQADTICLHGDGVNAVSNARLIRETLIDHGVEIICYGR
jgi:UPF0271 protein